MHLVTVTEAARLLHVSRSMIAYWKRLGLVTVYPYRNSEKSVKRAHRPPISTRTYMVDVDELRLLRVTDSVEELKRQHPDKNLLTRREIAKLIQDTEDYVSGIANRCELSVYRAKRGTSVFYDGDEFADALQDLGLSYLMTRKK